MKTLAFTKLVALFRSLENQVDEHEPFSQETLIWLRKFLEVVVLVYNNTQDNDSLRLEIVSTAREVLRISAARELLRLQQLTVNNDAWIRCFELAPAFALDLVKLVGAKPEDDPNDLTFSSRIWRAERDCMISECGNCNTAVIMSKESWEDKRR